MQHHGHNNTRRRFPRAVLPHGVTLRCTGNEFRGRIRILGEGGMFVDTIHPRPVGTEFEIAIESGDPIYARCVSRDIEPGWGMGVEFVQLREPDRARIRELVARYL